MTHWATGTTKPAANPATQLDFYENPVELEGVESGEFLGTILDPAERRLAFMVQENPV